ncbi:MAG: class I SAM-dependent methyltransferase [Planctomycetota bacterium]|nr:class I SAM-dependent methyltransferase [Planctomycetota bacterium]
MNPDSAKKIFDDSSENWARDEPKLLSDWTARPFLLDWCLPVEGKRVLDLGCGEGYFTRQLSRKGADRVQGSDISSGMIEAARANEAKSPLGIEYAVGCATDLSALEGESFDLITAVFVYNYLKIDQMRQSLRQIFSHLKTGGQLVFSLPHPVNPFLTGTDSKFHFERSGGWFSGRDQIFEGTIALRDGETVAVRCIHKTFEDVFSALRDAGFEKFPEMRELAVTEEHLASDASFFGPLKDLPLHIAIRVER